MPDAIPENIGKYHVLKRVGSGGFGVVYLAHDPTLDRKVAIKVMRRGRAGQTEVRRLRREAKAAAALDHPALVRIIEILELANGDPALVMDWVEGETLAERISKGRIEPLKALTLIRQIAQGLHAAHSASFIHRDIKAENVMLKADAEGNEQAVILDFGLARAMDLDSSTATTGLEIVTDENVIIGTPHAMSPEQILGKALDQRSDIFSLGALAYHMVTGMAPFLIPGDSKGTEIRVLMNAVEPAHSLVGTLPLELSLLIGRMLDKDPIHRPQTTVEIVETLRSWETGTTPLTFLEDWNAETSETEAWTEVQEQGTLSESTERVLRPPARNRRAVVASTALLVLVAVFAVFFVRTPSPRIAVLGIGTAMDLGAMDLGGSTWLGQGASEVLE